MNYSSFFAEFPDSKQFFKLTFLLLLSLFVALLGISVVPNQAPATYYLWFIGSVLFFSVFEFVNEKNQFIGLNFFGANRQKLVLGLLVGIIIGFFVVSNQLVVLGVPSTFSVQSSLNFLYIVVVAVLAEEFFFRGFIFPTLAKTINPITAVIATSALFAVFHFYVYIIVAGLPWFAMIAPFAFSVLAIIGNQYFKTLGFGVGFHLVNNYLSFFKVI